MKKIESIVQTIECTFKFKCDRQWSDLHELIELNVKYCEQCQKNVYLCKTQEEINQARLLGRCISIERVEVKMFTTGVPY
jgi:hypothetical protein